MNWRRIWPLREPQDRAAAASGGTLAEYIRGRSPYSGQYETIVGQGHERPTPSFGAPTLVWHVGVWPRPAWREADQTGDTADQHDPSADEHDKARRKFDAQRYAWIEEINSRLAEIEKKGRWRTGGATGRAKKFLPNPPLKKGLGFLEPSNRIDAGAVGMTLWWKDPRDPSGEATAIRVRMHSELTADYVTYSFYMDIGQLWEAAPGSAGVRRKEILDAVESVRDLCQSRLTAQPPAPVILADAPPLPEDLPPGADEALMSARNLLYVSVWEDFARDMGCVLSQLAGDRGEVFANFRGVVMATGGLPAPSSEEISVNSNPFPKFSADPRFDADGPEANATIRAYWPFIRRITPGADYREFVACGVLDWRALYVSALGSSSQWDPGEERAVAASDKTERDIGVREEVLAGHAAATRDDDGSVWPRVHRDGNNHPVRYLVLTKHDPNPRQIGRIVERINAMGTLRLYALKDWVAIKEADSYIRILGQELDKITRDWSDKRRLIESLQTLRQFASAKRQEKYRPIRNYLDKVFVPGIVTRMLRRVRAFVLSLVTFWELKQLVRKDEQNAVHDTKYALLYEVSSELETKLIAIGAALDEIGVRTDGGLHFRINRSRFHADHFRRLIETLEVHNVQTWVSYEQFVQRGLEPAFEYVASVGSRVRSLRDRLQTVSETIETSALVGQSAATRYNTAVLRQVTTIMVAVLAVYLSKLAFPGVYRSLAGYAQTFGSAWGEYLWAKLLEMLEYGGWLGAAGVIAVLIIIFIWHKVTRS